MARTLTDEQHHDNRRLVLKQSRRWIIILLVASQLPIILIAAIRSNVYNVWETYATPMAAKFELRRHWESVSSSTSPFSQQQQEQQEVSTNSSSKQQVVVGGREEERRRERVFPSQRPPSSADDKGQIPVQTQAYRDISKAVTSTGKGDLNHSEGREERDAASTNTHHAERSLAGQGSATPAVSEIDGNVPSILGVQTFGYGGRKEEEGRDEIEILQLQSQRSVGGDEGWGTPLRAAEKGLSCEDWLAEGDVGPPLARDFAKDPIYVMSREISDWPKCGVQCHFVDSLPSRLPNGPGPLSADAAFEGSYSSAGALRVVRSMESATNYPSIAREEAQKEGVGVLMTTDLESDVPAGYFSWAEYDLMADLPENKPEMAAAFISNCHPSNHRMEALQKLQDLGVSVHSYGACMHNRQESGQGKVKDLEAYKFSLAFENSNEPDYVTEKFFQSLVAGAIPVVVGAQNIEDFAPANETILHISSIDDVPAVADRMNALAQNATALAHMTRWKREGPSEQFLALVDMAAVHSSCRLCIHLATRVRAMERESAASVLAGRPCRCAQRGGKEVVYHLFVRERGRFDLESVFLRSSNLTLEGLHQEIWETFRRKGHEPIWEPERPEKLKRGGSFKVYRVYPVGATQRAALYGHASIRNNMQLVQFLHNNPCPELEVIFV